MKMAVRSMACAGAGLLVLGVVLFLSGECWGEFLRSDTAPWGFAVLGAICLTGAARIFLTGRRDASQAKERKAAKTAGARAARIASAVQPLLLSMAVVLQIFAGYQGIVPLICLAAVLVVSAIVL